jgi:tetratricopeptide (TPR) repeat protein
MKIKQIFCVLTVFVFASVLYAQRGGMPGPSTTQSTQPQPQTQNRIEQPGLSEAEMEEIRNKMKAKEPQGPHPLSEKELTKEIKSLPEDKVIKDVMDLGVDFDMTPAIEKKLRKAKATDQIVEAVRQAGPTVREKMAKLNLGSGQGGVKSIPKEEAQAFDAIKVELDPDKAIAMVDDFAKKYPNSIVLSYVYSFGANAYQQKGDVEKVVEYSSKSLKLKPDNLLSLMLNVAMLPQPQYLNAHTAERAQILQEAESEAKRALELIPQIQKQPKETDADYKNRQNELASQVHGPLGMIHLDLASDALGGADKAELAKAEQEFNTAVNTATRPDPRDYYRMGEAYTIDGKWDDAIKAFTMASALGQGSLIKTYADQRIIEVKKKKAGG